jgi:hypothetical protein
MTETHEEPQTSAMSDDEVAAIAQAFYEDSADLCRQGLAIGGYRIPRSDSVDQVILKYYNLLKRYIEPKRRRVWYSRGFECPPEYTAGVRRLAKLTEEGQDINSYQSTRLRKAQLNDWLLNDWGVHHFHLGTSLESDGFVARTGSLLFARVDPYDVYFLTVGNHDDFTRQELVRILHTNWPETISRYRLHGIMGGTAWTDDDIKALRRSHSSSFLQMSDGTIYMGPGGGYSSDGTSADVLWKRNELLRTCRYFAGLVRDYLDVMKDGCAKNGINFVPPYQFRLRVINGVAYSWEERYDAVLNLSTPLTLPTMSIPYFGKLTSRSHA